MKNRSLTVIHCDDDEDDRLLLKEAFHEAHLPTNNLCSTCDGVELLDYLKQSCDTANPEAPPRPDMILLDLNMPRMDGTQALREIKKNPDYRFIPIVILSTSNDPSTVRQCYKDGANSFISKPTVVDEFVSILKNFKTYWFETVELPENQCR